jgi:sugar phosphate isomerase/epimerase
MNDQSHNQASGKMATLTPSLLSSFCCRGVSFDDEAIAPYRNGDEAISADLYLFMEEEANEWYGILRRIPGALASKTSHPSNAVELLAGLTADGIAEIGDHLAKRFHALGSKIIGLASFVPEIARPFQPGNRHVGASAVASLIGIARCLQIKGHSPTTVELVTGSRIQSILAGRKIGSSGEKRFFVRLLESEDEQRIARKQLLDNLVRALHLSKQLGQESDQEHPIRLALELEPGDGFVLNDPRSLETLADEIAAHDELVGRVGFNLDIAHWIIEGITPDWILDRENVWGQIVHSHINDHHRKAHFGDVPLFDLNGPGEYTPWISLLRRLVERPRSRNDFPRFSGHVSLELEAAKNGQIVRDTFVRLEELLAGDGASRP